MPARQHRITRGSDYRRIVRSGRRVGGALCITHAVLHMQPAPARFGFIISKAVGNAVTRNLIRRRLKFIVEQRLHVGFRSADVVFRVLPPAAEASFEELAREVNRSLDKVERFGSESSESSVSAGSSEKLRARSVHSQSGESRS